MNYGKSDVQRYIDAGKDRTVCALGEDWLALHHALEDCYLLARRKRAVSHRYALDTPEPVEQIGPSSADADWDHVIRFCEQAGLNATVLRVGER